MPLEHATTDVVPQNSPPREQQTGVVPAAFEPVPAPPDVDQHAADLKSPALAAQAEPPARLSRDSFGIVEPQTARDFAARAGDWLRIKMYDKAIADCDEAIELGSHDPTAHIYRGLAWREKKEYDKAIADYDEALWLEPNNAFAFYARASAWGSKKEYARADADLAQASLLAR